MANEGMARIRQLYCSIGTKSKFGLGAEVDEHKEPAWREPAGRARLKPGRQAWHEGIGREQTRKSQPNNNCQTVGGYPEMDVAIRRSGQDLFECPSTTR